MTPLLNPQKRVVRVIGPNFKPPGLEQFFVPKNAIFGHFYPISQRQILKKCTYSQMAMFSTPRNLGKLVQKSGKKWPKIAFSGPKTAIFGHFCALAAPNF